MSNIQLSEKRRKMKGPVTVAICEGEGNQTNVEMTAADQGYKAFKSVPLPGIQLKAGPKHNILHCRSKQ